MNADDQRSRAGVAVVLESGTMTFRRLPLDPSMMVTVVMLGLSYTYLDTEFTNFVDASPVGALPFFYCAAMKLGVDGCFKKITGDGFIQWCLTGFDGNHKFIL